MGEALRDRWEVVVGNGTSSETAVTARGVTCSRSEGSGFAG